MALKSLEDIQLPGERIIAAQDQDTWEEALEGLEEYGDVVGLAKVNSLADRTGVDRAVETIGQHGSLAMLDWKFHDIDDTMRRRTREATLAGVSIMTVHGSAGSAALHRAREGVDEALAMDPTLERPWVLGITVLTSIGDEAKDGQESCVSIYGDDRRAKVMQFAEMAEEAGLDGVVCSYAEAEMLKSNPRTERLKLVIPAIRPEFSLSTPDEQKQATTPKRAIEAGADMLVIGRPLINARRYELTRRESALLIAEEIKEAL